MRPITGGVATKYVAFPGLGVVAKRVTTTTYWLHTDRLGSVVALTDSSGAIAQRRSFRPYGETIASETGHTEARGWIDQRNDPETGLTYLHARYYDSLLGVFLSPDPAMADPNTYRYAGADPVNRLDPTGLDWQCTTTSSSFAGGPTVEETTCSVHGTDWSALMQLLAGSFLPNAADRRLAANNAARAMLLGEMQRDLAEQDSGTTTPAAATTTTTTTGGVDNKPGRLPPGLWGKRTPEEEKRFNKAFDNAIDRIAGDEMCGDFFGGAGENTMRDTTYYITPLRPPTGAATNSDISPRNFVQVDLNNSGFPSSGGSATWGGGATKQALILGGPSDVGAMTLLHELSHQLSGTTSPPRRRKCA